MTFYGMLNIRNEAEWIEEVLNSLLPLCDLIFILDDHSTDRTPDICRAFGPRVRFYESPFPDQGDKTRDKNYIYERVLEHLPSQMLNERSPYWVVAIDGDEVLSKDGTQQIRNAVEEASHALALKVLYLWDAPDQIRVDGLYDRMFRPSVFRVINPAFRFQPTPFPANLHCPNVPQELCGHAVRCGAHLKHYGYMRRDQRLKKYLLNIAADPNNAGEDFYRHVVIGDLPSLPPESVTRFAGPLTLKAYAP